MSSAKLIDKYGINITIQRAGNGGDYVKGEWVPAPATALPIKASVQPVSGKDMKMLPQGAHPEEHLKLYTKVCDPLQTKRLSRQADRFQYRGRAWEIILTKSYMDIGITRLEHHMSVAAMVPND